MVLKGLIKSFYFSGLICRYEIPRSKRNIPFVVELKDRLTGAAEIKLKEGKKLNYHKRKHYKFNIFAYDCVDPPYGLRSKRLVGSLPYQLFL